MDGTDPDEAPVSSNVADLIEKVRRRMASAPTVADIRGIADQALAEDRSPLTVAEIVQLTDIALGKAREVEQVAARLARLTEAAR